MKGVVSLVISCCLFVVPVFAEDPVYFADETLKAEVEDALWVDDPTPTDMLGLVSLTAGSKGIESVTGLEYATNLTSLQLPCNQITDINILSGLTNLKKLVLNNNEISDLSPLTNLTNLEHIDMHDNTVISDLSPLSALTKLTTVILRGNNISNISVLANMTNLQTLRLEHNEISDISALANLTALTTLDLRDNPLNDDAYDVYIPQIEANNPGIIFTYTASPACFTISSTAGGSVIEPGEGEFNYTRTSSVLIEAEADPCFVFVKFSGTCSSTQNPVQITVDQDHQICANFMSLLTTLYVDNDAPNDPGPGDITESDALEKGTEDHPFDSIQEAIDVADEGTTIIVHSGTYEENISLMGKSIRVLGIDPNDPNTNDFPVIHGADNGPVVCFTLGEDPNCIFSGFVLIGGKGQPAGAILCTNSNPTIVNCLVVGNRTTESEGAAIHCSNSEATLINCTIVDNDTGDGGAGLRLEDSNIVLLNCILWDNGTNEILQNGTSVPLVNYNDIESGWTGSGNIDIAPLFVQRGYWGDRDDPNTVLDPSSLRATWIAGDYHLQSQAGRWDIQTQEWITDEYTSTCIDAGDPLELVGEEPDPNGGVINMGAYGGTSQASKTY